MTAGGGSGVQEGADKRPKISRPRMPDTALGRLTMEERRMYRAMEFRAGAMSAPERQLLRKYEGCFLCKELFAKSHYPSSCPYKR